MEHKKLLAKITIPNYIREVNLSNKQREKYYEWDGTTIKCRSKKLLQKYINQIYKNTIIKNNGNIRIQYLKDEYCIVGFKGDKIYSTIHNTEYEDKYILTEKQHEKPLKYILCKIIDIEEDFLEYNYEKVVANETQAGKPKKHIINGQAFYNQTLNQFARIKVVEAIKEFYYNKFKTIPALKLQSVIWTLNQNYPLYIEMEICDTIRNIYGKAKQGKGVRWDVGNRAEPYMKTFLDFITNGYISGDLEEGLYDIEPIIKDDDRLHVSSGNNAYFTPIENEKHCKLIFYIYADKRPIRKTILNLVNNEDWKNYCQYLTNNPNKKGLIEIATKKGYYKWKQQKQF